MTAGMTVCARRWVAARAISAVLAGLSAASPGRAEPLPKEACDQLAAEHDKFVAAGVRSWIAQGAAGARERLGAEKLAQIERFSAVDEQLLFRCGLYRVRFVPPPEPEEPAGEAPPAAPKVPKAATSPDKAGPKPKPKLTPKDAEPRQAARQPDTPNLTSAEPATKKPRTRADDAYKPIPPAPAR